MSAIRVSIGLVILASVAAAQAPLRSGFTYQGQIRLDGNLLTASADFQFSLWDAAGSGSPPTGGTQIGGTQTVTSVTVTDGLFTVVLNASDQFGPSAFNGDARWIQIAVRSPAGSGSYVTLAPRQELTAAPHAAFARNTEQLCGRPVDDLTPSIDQVLKWDGAFWTPDNDDNTTYTAGSGLMLTGAQFSLDLTYADGRYVNEGQTSAIGTSMLQDAAVTTAKLANAAVTDAKVSDVGWSKLTGVPSSFPPSGAAGGDLTGTYPNPSLANSAVNSAKIADGAIQSADLAFNCVDSGKVLDGSLATTDLADSAVTTAKISASGAASGRAIYYTGSSVAWGNPTPGGTAGGDLTGTYPNPSIASNAVTSAKISDSTIATADLANGAVTTAKVSTSGASSGNALMYNGSSVVWGGATPGGTAGGDLSGSYPNPTVANLRGRTVSTTAPSTGQMLQWSGSVWGPANDGLTLPYSGSTSNSSYAAFSATHTAANSDQPAVVATHAVSDYYGVGLRALAGWKGVDVQVYPTGSQQYYGVDITCAGGSGTNIGVYADVETSGDPHGVHATAYGLGSSSAYGVFGFASGDGSGTKYAVYGTTGGSGTRYAGYFVGNASVTGTLSKGGGSFKIDHPLDPANKYLLHSFVESPDMMNVYNGNVVTDQDGYAAITMPDWFDALNRDFRYQLTVLDDNNSDEFVLAKVVRKIENNQFIIRTNAPYTEVSWQVTGIRQDPFANANRIPVELDKNVDERGLYLHPQAWGLPEELGVNYAEVQRALVSPSGEKRAEID